MVRMRSLSPVASRSCMKSMAQTWLVMVAVVRSSCSFASPGALGTLSRNCKAAAFVPESSSEPSNRQDGETQPQSRQASRYFAPVHRYSVKLRHPGLIVVSRLPVLPTTQPRLRRSPQYGIPHSGLACRGRARGTPNR